MNIRTGAACVAVLAAAGATHAAVIMQTQNFGTVNNVPDYTESLSFNQFDPSLGTLLSVKVKLTLNVSGGALGVDNESPSVASGSASFGANATITGVGVTLLDNAFNPVTGAASAVNNYMYTLQPDDGDNPLAFDLGGTDSQTFNGLPASDMKMGFINPLFFAGFTGVGTYGIDVNATQVFTLTDASGISRFASPLIGDGNVMVIYEYEPIPAPGAMALVALGGLLVARRRR